MNKTLYENLFIHKETEKKIEVALYVSTNKSRDIIDTILARLKSVELDIDSGIPLYLKAELRKKSDTNWTESIKCFIGFNRRVYFARIYKMVWPSYFKVEITIFDIEADDNRKKLVKEVVRLYHHLMKWLEDSTLPYYFQAKDVFTPVSKYLE